VGGVPPDFASRSTLKFLLVGDFNHLLLPCTNKFFFFFSRDFSSNLLNGTLPAFESQSFFRL
jgi:hypothetical protein